MNKVRVALWGFGAMGKGIVEMLLEKQGVEIVGVCGRKSNIGKEIHQILNIEQKENRKVIIVDDPDKAIGKGKTDIVMLTSDSFVKENYEKIKFCLQRKANVISIAEEMAYPLAQNKSLAIEIDQMARENGVTVLGTGINPGFVMDLLILMLTGACRSVDHISAKRINDLSHFGSAVMSGQGVGVDVQTFRQGVADGSIVGHVGFPESIRMIADGIGWKIDSISESREAITTTIDRRTNYATVKSGDVAGCCQIGTGYVGGKALIELEHPQQIVPEAENIETGDYITISGNPNITLQIKPEIPGGIGTVAVSVNMIPHVINSEAGLKTMLDLPIPRAIMGDMRELIKEKP